MASNHIRLSIRTNAHNELKDITHLIQQEIRERNIIDGMCVMYVPHTTAGITINENADPDVKTDIINTLHHIVPDNLTYRHAEGNSPGHVKASLLGSRLAYQ